MKYNVKKENFLGEKLYHEYPDLIAVIDQVIKKEGQLHPPKGGCLSLTT